MYIHLYYNIINRHITAMLLIYCYLSMETVNY